MKKVYFKKCFNIKKVVKNILKVTGKSQYNKGCKLVRGSRLRNAVLGNVFSHFYPFNRLLVEGATRDWRQRKREMEELRERGFVRKGPFK